MLTLAPAAIARATPYPALVASLEAAFRDGVVAPVRAHHTVPTPGQPDATLLLMPAWITGRYLGVKVATVFPGAPARGRPAVAAQYLLLDGLDGSALALLDGGELTARRTAAASALAARHLAREDAKVLTVVGTGRVARALAEAHVALRPGLKEVRVWGRSRSNAVRAVDALRRGKIPAEPVSDLEGAVRTSDLISVATLATSPLIRGAWLAPGAHLDLVGGFTPQMREADDNAVARARVFCDVRESALCEAGDLAGPIAAGRLDPAAVADLPELCRGLRTGRATPDEITLFKSVGCALEDLAAAILVYESQKKVRTASTTP